MSYVPANELQLKSVEIMVKGGIPFRVKPHPHPLCPNRRSKDRPMKGKHHGEGESKDLIYGYLEIYAR